MLQLALGKTVGQTLGFPGYLAGCVGGTPVGRTSPEGLGIDDIPRYLSVIPLVHALDSDLGNLIWSISYPASKLGRPRETRAAVGTG